MKSNVIIGRTLEILDSLDKQGIKIPVIIMSSPGFGKTTTIEMWCKCKDYNLTTLIASQYSQDDILGIQAVNNGKLERLAPAWFNKMNSLAENGKRNVLFIDEITTCDEFIQAPLLNLIFSRSLGLHSLPENTIIVTAGNYLEELNGVFSMTAPLVNRFIILNLIQSDFNLNEVILDRISDINSVEDMEKYLELNDDTLPDNSLVPERLGMFITKRLGFTESKIRDNSVDGLIGFSSVRSISNCIKFYKEWCKHYDTDQWTRIVGDTLGIDKTKDEVFIRDLLQKNEQSYFRAPIGKARQTIQKTYAKDFKTVIMEICGGIDVITNEGIAKEYIKDGLSPEDYKLLGMVASVSAPLAELYRESGGTP